MEYSFFKMKNHNNILEYSKNLKIYIFLCNVEIFRFLTGAGGFSFQKLGFVKFI
jgi:hypothetical protein